MDVSVVIPAHNAEGSLSEALESVGAQTHAPREVIVVVDRSTDGTQAVAEASDIVTHLLTTEFGNGAAARNAGIEQASGEYIAFLDADDYWRPEHLASAADVLGRGGDVAYLGAAQYFYGAEVRRMRPAESPWFEQPTINLSAGTFLELFAERQRIAMPTIVTRKARLTEIGNLSTSQLRRHDIDMWLRLIADSTWAYDPRALVVCCADTPGSISRNIPESARYYLRALLRNEAAYAGRPMTTLITRAARNTLSTALTDGEDKHLKLALELAWERLAPHDRLIFAVARQCPTMFRRLNRLRRKITV